jgi:hypothetical protein
MLEQLIWQTPELPTTVQT